MIVEKLWESFTSPYDLMFVFFMFVNCLPFWLLISECSFRYFERVMDFFATVVRQHGVVKGTLIILAGMCFFSLSFYLLCSVTVDFIRDHYSSLNCPDETTCLSGIANSEPHLNEDLSNRAQDSENEIGSEQNQWIESWRLSRRRNFPNSCKGGFICMFSLISVVLTATGISNGPPFSK